jgi:hypothetical protein
MSALTTETLASIDALKSVAAAWDDLACANGRPQMAPAWVLGWFRHLAPATVEPRTIVVRDGEQIVAIAPFFVEPGKGRVDYRIPNIETCAGLSPLALPGREAEAAAAIAARSRRARTSSPSRGYPPTPRGRRRCGPGGRGGARRCGATSPSRARRSRCRRSPSKPGWRASPRTSASR